NVIDPLHLIEQYGLDPVRYFLLREVPFGKDGDFSHRAMVGRLNGDLANDFGNLAQRVLSMIQKNCDAQAPTPGALTDADTALLDRAGALLDRLRAEFRAQAFHKALIAIWEVVGEANRYVDEQAPWTLRKTDTARMATVLYVLAETIRRLALVAQPFMPESMGRLLDQLGQSDQARDFTAMGQPLEAGTALPKPVGIFPRYVEGSDDG
ncbi:MAG: class I tRNA ligase family protein, partial [Alphaproteobacteria bacterium]